MNKWMQASWLLFLQYLSVFPIKIIENEMVLEWNLPNDYQTQTLIHTLVQAENLSVPWLTPEVSATEVEPGAETKLCDLGEHPQALWINKEQSKLKIIKAKTRF